MAEPFIVVSHVGEVVHLELNRPESANTFSPALVSELDRTITELAQRTDIGAVLVSGRGPRFCAGGDLGSIGTADDPAAHIEELARITAAPLLRLARLPVPVVAVVHGSVAGAGIGLMLAADVIVAAASTRFVAAYPAVGLTPDCAVSYLLPRAVGQQRALEFLLTGRVVGADEALRWGLVNEVSADDAVIERGMALASTMAALPSASSAGVKALVRDTWSKSIDAAVNDESVTIGAAMRTDQARLLVNRFLAR